MKVIYTEEALRNLDDISEYIRQNYPAISEAFRLRLQFVVARIAKWPESAQQVADQSGVRVVPLSVSIQSVLSGSEQDDRNTVHPSLGPRCLVARGNRDACSETGGLLYAPTRRRAALVGSAATSRPISSLARRRSKAVCRLSQNCGLV